MEAVLFRTGSGSISGRSSFVTGSTRSSIAVYESIGGVVSCERYHSSSPRISLHLEPKRRGIRRASSETEVIRSATEMTGRFKALSKLGSRSFPGIISKEEFSSERDDVTSGLWSFSSFTTTDEKTSLTGDRTESCITAECVLLPGGGIGKNHKTNRNDGGSGDEFTGGNADLKRIGAYYQEMLKLNPTNSLLLRNYGQYLHEVERDMVKAEEYYGRAILASPEDGEVLSLYGKLIWETQRDESRAKSYFDQAVHASPHDCMVLGSYAHFMWESEGDEEEECVSAAAGPSMVGAY